MVRSPMHGPGHGMDLTVPSTVRRIQQVGKYGQGRRTRAVFGDRRRLWPLEMRGNTPLIVLSRADRNAKTDRRTSPESQVTSRRSSSLADTTWISTHQTMLRL